MPITIHIVVSACTVSLSAALATTRLLITASLAPILATTTIPPPSLAQATARHHITITLHIVCHVNCLASPAIPPLIPA